MKRAIFLGVALVLSALFLLTQTLEAAPELKGEIKIGQTISFAGGSFLQTTNQTDGSKIAVEEINKLGGVLGRKLVYIMRDNEGKPERAVTQAKELCVRHNIDFSLSCLLSSNSRAISAVYQEYKIPNVLLASMATEIMDLGNPYYMRLCGDNAVNGVAMATVVKKGNYKRPGLIYLNDFWGVSLRKIMHQEMEGIGLKIVSEESIDMGVPDMSPQVMKILAAQPDVILALVYAGDLANFVRTAKGQGYKGYVVGYSGVGVNATRMAAGHDVDNVVFPVGFYGQAIYVWNNPGAIPLLLKLEEAKSVGKYPLVNASPDIEHLGGYQGVYNLKEWITKAGERGLKDKDYFMDVVAKSKFHFVATELSFPQGRKRMDAITPEDMYLMQYSNGHLRVWEHDPRCIETFETTRIQAEEEVYSKGFTPKVTFRKYLTRWQELLRGNEAKVKNEIEEKLKKGVIKVDYANMVKQAVAEILAYKF